MHKLWLNGVVMYRCESWAIKKVERRRIDVFELWCWRRLLRVSWTARRSNQSILKEINPEYSLEELMLPGVLQSMGSQGVRHDLVTEQQQQWRQQQGAVKGR